MLYFISDIAAEHLLTRGWQWCPIQEARNAGHLASDDGILWAFHSEHALPLLAALDLLLIAWDLWTDSPRDNSDKAGDRLAAAVHQARLIREGAWPGRSKGWRGK